MVDLVMKRAAETSNKKHISIKNKLKYFKRIYVETNPHISFESSISFCSEYI